MNRQNFDARFVQNFEEAMKSEPGAVFWQGDPDSNDYAELAMILPEKEVFRSIPVTRNPKLRDDYGGPCWLLTGPKDAPTLHPSINCLSDPKWHGWLRNGVFVSC